LIASGSLPSKVLQAIVILIQVENYIAVFTVQSFAILGDGGDLGSTLCSSLLPRCCSILFDLQTSRLLANDLLLLGLELLDVMRASGGAVRLGGQKTLPRSVEVVGPTLLLG